MTDEERQRTIDALCEPFPRHAVKQREGGRGKMLDYIATDTVIRRLNRATGYRWDWSIIRQERDGDLLTVVGELTIPGLGTRAGTGVQKLSERGGEDLVKGAASDALKKAATLFGVGLELYGPDLEAGTPPTRPERPQERANGGRVPFKAHADDAEPYRPQRQLRDEQRARQTPQAESRPPAPTSAAAPPNGAAATTDDDGAEEDVGAYSWTAFWSAAREAGLRDWPAINQRIGEDAQARRYSPAQVRDRLRECGVVL